MPYIFKKDNTYIVYAEGAFDNYNSNTFDSEDNIVEIITSKEQLLKFDIDATTVYEKTLKIDAQLHQNDSGDNLENILGE
jgi:hypothetical protein